LSSGNGKPRTRPQRPPIPKPKHQPRATCASNLTDER
jgi:hypothetical protein